MFLMDIAECNHTVELRRMDIAECNKTMQLRRLICVHKDRKCCKGLFLMHWYISFKPIIVVIGQNLLTLVSSRSIEFYGEMARVINRQNALYFYISWSVVQIFC